MHYYQVVYMLLINCPQCGKRISADADFCPDCGFNLRKYMNAKPEQHRTSGGGLLKIACAVMLFVAVSLAVFALIVRHGDVTETAASAPDSSPAEVVAADDTNSNASSDFKLHDSVNASDADSHPASDIDISSAVGVYRGDEGNMLVLRSNGLANYYCYDIAYTDINCSWELRDGQILIRLDKLRCTVTAAADGDIDRLTFVSDSQNWQTEEFDRVDVDPEEYIKRRVMSYDSNVKVQDDGAMRCSLGGLSFTVPKYFCDIKDELDENTDITTFVSVDVDNDYAATLTFYADKTSYSRTLSQEKASSLAERFSAMFYADTAVAEGSKITVAGMPAYIFSFDAYYNQNYYAHTGYKIEGYIAVICNSSAKSMVYAMLEQHSGRNIDDREALLQILGTTEIY